MYELKVLLHRHALHPRRSKLLLQLTRASNKKKIHDVCSFSFFSFDSLQLYGQYKRRLILNVGGSTSRHRQASTASHSGRRRSTVLNALQMNDPTLPPQGEIVSESQNRTASPMSLTGSPITASGDHRHYRAPSLGEIHQELEQEQEAQVVSCYSVRRCSEFSAQQLISLSSRIAFCI